MEILWQEDAYKLVLLGILLKIQQTYVLNNVRPILLPIMKLELVLINALLMKIYMGTLSPIPVLLHAQMGIMEVR